MCSAEQHRAWKMRMPGKPTCMSAVSQRWQTMQLKASVLVVEMMNGADNKYTHIDTPDTKCHYNGWQWGEGWARNKGKSAIYFHQFNLIPFCILKLQIIFDDDELYLSIYIIIEIKQFVFVFFRITSFRFQFISPNNSETKRIRIQYHVGHFKRWVKRVDHSPLLLPLVLMSWDWVDNLRILPPINFPSYLFHSINIFHNFPPVFPHPVHQHCWRDETKWLLMLAEEDTERKSHTHTLKGRQQQKKNEVF